MSSKAARGTKRTCQDCGARFYDLNRDPIICPICSSEVQLTGAAAEAQAQRAAEAAESSSEEDDSLLGDSGDVEVISLEQAEAEAEDKDIPDIEGDDIDDLETDNNLKDDETALMPDDDNEDDDVSGYIGGSIDDKDDET